MALLPSLLPTTDLQVYKKDGTVLQGAVIKKYTWQKSYGAFESKIAGQLLYQGKGLDTAMLLGCYVVSPIDSMKYTIINAPTSESFLYVKDNNGLNGNNRYSCEFFAPEYFLTQFEFRDLPLDTDESIYRGGQTKFYLCCSIDELILRVQKNLDVYNYYIPEGEGKWEIKLQGANKGIPQINPIEFDGDSIADVLKKIEDEYGLPYFIQYNKPTYTDANAHIFIGDVVETMPSGKVFDFGQNKGLTSSIRNSKKEGIVTKLYARGSTNNVPFRYPVFRETPTVEFPMGEIINHSYYSETLMPQFWVDAVENKVVNGIDNPIIEYLLAQNPSYPNPQNKSVAGAFPAPNKTWENLYDVKTPFVEHADYEDIQPTIRNVEFPEHSGNHIDMLRDDSYGNNEKIWWDDSFFGQTTEPNSPTFKVKAKVTFTANDTNPRDFWGAIDLLTYAFSGVGAMGYQGTPGFKGYYIDVDETDYKASFYDSSNNFVYGGTLARDFEKFPFYFDTDIIEFTFRKFVYQTSPYEPVIIYPNANTHPYAGSNMSIDFSVGGGAPNIILTLTADAFQGFVSHNYVFIDDINPDTGELVQSMFYLPLKQFDFDLYESAIENEDMFIHMTSGSCQGSRFKIAIQDWSDWVTNFYKVVDGIHVFTGRRTLLTHPDDTPTDEATYPDTSKGAHDILVFKDIETWGQNFVQPTALRFPSQDDKFVITGITLPQSYLNAAQLLLQERALADLESKNRENFDYNLQVSNIFLEEHPEYKNFIDTNIKIRFLYNNTELTAYFNSISIQFGEALPKYDVKISDILSSRRTTSTAFDWLFADVDVAKSQQLNDLQKMISVYNSIIVQRGKQRLDNRLTSNITRSIVNQTETNNDILASLSDMKTMIDDIQAFGVQKYRFSFTGNGTRTYNFYNDEISNLSFAEIVSLNGQILTPGSDYTISVTSNSGMFDYSIVLDNEWFTPTANDKIEILAFPQIVLV